MFEVYNVCLTRLKHLSSLSTPHSFTGEIMPFHVLEGNGAEVPIRQKRRALRCEPQLCFAPFIFLISPSPTAAATLPTYCQERA
jgi:hypothetical protein